MEYAITEKRGGKREKSGAPRGNHNAPTKPPEEKRVMQSFRLKPETIAKIKAYAMLHSVADNKMSLADVIDLAISRLTE